MDHMESPCWIWEGSKSPHSSKGYYKVQYKKHRTFVHRIAYKLYYGQLDPDLQVLHSCDNTACCNPHHLRQGTNKQNQQDKVDRGRSGKGQPRPYLQGIPSHRRCLTPDQVRLVRETCKTHSQRETSRLLGIPRGVIRDIQKGVSYKEVS